MIPAVRFRISTSLLGGGRVRRALGPLAGGFLIITVLVSGALSLAWPRNPIDVHVRWRDGVTDAQRVGLERRFGLTAGEPTEGTTWRYQLADSSSANIRSLIQHEGVDDTAHLNRRWYRPEFGQDRPRQIAAYSMSCGAVGSLLLLLITATARRTPSQAVAARTGQAFAPAAGRVAGTTRVDGRDADRRAAADRRWTAVILIGLLALASAGMTVFAGASVISAAGALLVAHVGGYVAGWLLVSRLDGLALAVIRTAAGLLLATMAFLLSLVLTLPWFVGPAVLVGVAAVLGRGDAFSWPRVLIRFRWDHVGAGILAAIIVCPIVLTYLYMAPGPFPPVFYNIDTAYTLEKVHALTAADTYPPPSLSNVGVRRTYHYGSQAMAALISRSSGLLPHHALFVIVLPLLTAGVLAAAASAARSLGPALPCTVTVPLLLISTPALSIPFWDKFGPQLWAAAASERFSVAGIVGNHDLWGILSNEGMNVGSDFLILGSVAAVAAAPAWGWRLAAFAVGSAILVKTTAGVALIAGFGLAELWRGLRSGNPWPSRQLLMAAGMFAATVAAFFVVSFENNFRVELAGMYHVREMTARGHFPALTFDVVWLLLPVLIVLFARVRDPHGRSVPILLMGLAPLLVVNATRLEHIGAGGAGAGDDWFQTLHPVPFLLHAFALSVVGSRWDRLGRRWRAAVLVALALTIAPVAVAAAHYAQRLVRAPESGNDFTDNRSLAGALAAIPTHGTVIVTNDLRYPAGNFTRDYRQMQIPALFGHQAFAVNYAHEAVEHRRGLQEMLQQPNWSETILDAARTHGWTHLLIRKDYVHPSPVSLRRIFENADYEVFEFP